MQTVSGGDAMATNSGSNTGGLSVQTVNGGNVGIAAGIGRRSGIAVQTVNGGNATATNFGNNTGGLSATASNGGNATVTNSGTNTGGLVAATFNGGNATVINSGTNAGTLVAEEAGTGNGNAAVTNSGSTGSVSVVADHGAASLTNSGTINGGGGPAILLTAVGPAMLTNIVGGRVIGSINIIPSDTTINFVGGNWLVTFNALAGASINTNGAPFVVSGNQIAVLDQTSFALADRALMYFTGDIQEMLQGRFDGMTVGAGGGGGALGFTREQSSPPGVANAATQAFSGIPSVAMSYASDARATLGKAPVAAAPYYDTTVWASGFSQPKAPR